MSQETILFFLILVVGAIVACYLGYYLLYSLKTGILVVSHSVKELRESPSFFFYWFAVLAVSFLSFFVILFKGTAFYRFISIEVDIAEKDLDIKN